MKIRANLLAALFLPVIALLSRPAHAGDRLPPMELEEFTQTKAKTFDDLAGRAVLIEFFAYW